MKIKIESYEAMANLPELLKAVRAGNQYTITVRGTAVADLIPSKVADRASVGEAVARMHTLMTTSPPIRGVGIKTLIDQGRN